MWRINWSTLSLFDAGGEKEQKTCGAFGKGANKKRRGPGNIYNRNYCLYIPGKIALIIDRLTAYKTWKNPILED
jgi:hypothetical protein